MVIESELGRFRHSESTGKPLGGNVSDQPFPQALSGLARSRGFETQKGLGRAIGIDSANIGTWYRGERAPSPDSFGRLLQVLQPDDSELDSLVDSYCDLIQKGFGVGVFPGSEAAIRSGSSHKVRATTEIGRWIEDFCFERKISMKHFSQNLSITVSSMARDKLGINSLSCLLQEVPSKFDLAPEEIEELSEAVAQTLETRLARGEALVTRVATKHIQKGLERITYNGQQAADELGISRERVRQLRVKYNLPLLLTPEDLDMLRAAAIPKRHIVDTPSMRSREVGRESAAKAEKPSPSVIDAFLGPEPKKMPTKRDLKAGVEYRTIPALLGERFHGLAGARITMEEILGDNPEVTIIPFGGKFYVRVLDTEILQIFITRRLAQFGLYLV